MKIVKVKLKSELKNIHIFKSLDPLTEEGLNRIKEIGTTLDQKISNISIGALGDARIYEPIGGGCAPAVAIFGGDVTKKHYTCNFEVGDGWTTNIILCEDNLEFV